MSYAVEQFWQSKRNGKRVIVRPYGDMAQSSLIPDFTDIQSRREFLGEKGRGALPKYKLERRLDRAVPVVHTDGSRGNTLWAPVPYRPADLEAAVNYANSGPYRVLERQWDGSYVPLGTAAVNRASQTTTTKSDAPRAQPTGSGFKGKRKFW